MMLATTADASIGRAFDKAARTLGLSWGTRGPSAALEELCRMINDELESLPDIQPFTIRSRENLPFPFSREIAPARAFQTAAAHQLRAKLTLSLRNLKLKGVNVRDVALSGGVASNIFLRERLRAALDEYSAYRSIPPARIMHRHWSLAGDYDDYTVDLRAKWSIENIRWKKVFYIWVANSKSTSGVRESLVDSKRMKPND
ncbi:uncharacterized protein BJ212DRAFT_1589423 [Suillus subaureus]|uniref:Gcp-like domain-containing protein n=1 Tax=Suillus subaureus TaxID=48587 RepID=A0A9P7JAJ7_9AGAM|nr:uncharacterized protein BJ212DRAFT_1589423 [Suillus subaureus]KAG1811161.1 hypothetical protein BJ212DRAFT_1589423 [Suillus subaureus]